MTSIVYFNGQFRPESEATLSVRSRALNYGLGCFAGIRGYRTDDGAQVNVFRLDRHVRRLDLSARILGLRLPGTREHFAAIIVELLRRNEVGGDVYIRPLIFADSNALAPVLDPETSGAAVYCMPFGRYLSHDPIDVCVSSWRRVRETAIPARAKPTAAYLNSALARREATERGFTEAILLTEEGFVSEGEDLGVPFVERHIGRTELYVADEMFLCGTGAEITAVRSVDGRIVGDGTLGPVTRGLSERFEAAVRGRLPARAQWLTPVW